MFLLIQALESDRAAILALEQAAFPEDEAASDESLQLRLEQASKYFFKLLSGKDIIGFVNGTRVPGPELHHDCMTSHVEDGPILVIHSVVIKAENRRTYLGLNMLLKYISYVKAANSGIKEIRLLTKPALVTFYMQAGFTFLGPSNVNHGSVQLTITGNAIFLNLFHDILVTFATIILFKGDVV